MQVAELSTSRTIQIGGRGGRAVVIDGETTMRLDALAALFGQRIGTPSPSLSSVATHICINARLDVSKATPDEIRAVLRAALTVEGI